MALCPRTCRISDNLFQNYEVVIDLVQYENLAAICTAVKQNLMACLKKNNLHHLSSLANDKKFHIHTGNIENFYNGQIGDIIWVCSGGACSASENE